MVRVALLGASAACLVGCASAPVSYQPASSALDAKWTSPECRQARLDASAYEARERENPGWGTGVFLGGVYGVALVAAIKDNARKQRKTFAREVHLKCSSLPLPKELEGDFSTRPRTKYP